MTLMATSFHDAVGFKVVTDNAVTTSALATNVTGAAGRLFSVAIDNAKTGSVVFVKIYTSATPVLTSTVPDMVLRCEASSTESYQVPYGIAFTELAFGATSDADPVSSSAPAGSVLVSVTCS